MIYKKLVIFILGLFLSGCLVTREEVRESVKREPITQEQQSRANSEVRYHEIEEQSRTMLGRIETLENNVNILTADKNGARIEDQNEKKALQEKLKIYEDALSKLETQYLTLAQKVEVLQASRSAPSRADNSAGSKNAFKSAQTDFAKKNWKEAIVSFEKYRSANPNGRHYGEATYKIGSSFHELSMKNEAKVFYNEVVAKFPKSEWAKKATQRLKTMN